MNKKISETVKKLIEDFKKTWKLLPFKLFVIVTALLVLTTLFFIKQKYVFAIIYFIWICNFFYSEVLGKGRLEKKNLFQNAYEWYIFILNIVFLFMYCTVMFWALNVTSILLLVGAIWLLLLINTFYSLFLVLISKNHLLFLTIAYVFAAFTTIVMFGFAYATFGSGGIEGNSLINLLTQENVKNVWDYVYFSSGVFYSATFGDLIPKGGLIKLITQIEVAFSVIIHVIFFGHILSKQEPITSKNKIRRNDNLSANTEKRKKSKGLLIITLIFLLGQFLIVGFVEHKYNQILDRIEFKPDAEIEVSPYLYEASFGEYFPLIVTNTGEFTLKDVYIGINSCEMEEGYREQYFLPLLPTGSERVIPFGNVDVVEGFKEGNCYPFSGRNRSIASYSFNIGKIFAGEEQTSSSLGCGICFFDTWIIANYTDSNQEKMFKKQINSSFTYPVELTITFSPTD